MKYATYYNLYGNLSISLLALYIYIYVYIYIFLSIYTTFYLIVLSARAGPLNPNIKSLVKGVYVGWGW